MRTNLLRGKMERQLKRCRHLLVGGVAALCLVSAVAVQEVSALPFNDDMVHDQPKVNEIQRPLPAGSIPLGMNHRFVESREAAVAMQNPVAATEDSVGRGERLFAVNCTPCHGKFTGYTPAGDAEFKIKIPLTSGLIPGPSLGTKAYAADPSRTDGYIFSYIYFGGLATMPRYGYKLSITDHWNIVNYVRSIQPDVAARATPQE